MKLSCSRVYFISHDTSCPVGIVLLARDNSPMRYPDLASFGIMLFERTTPSEKSFPMWLTPSLEIHFEVFLSKLKY
nr:MAG TPA: hypothetical protein [Bacteriophage sp.]